MDSKTDIINKAIQEQTYLSFNYVSTSRKISKDRLVKPIELLLTDKHGLKLWAKDYKAGMLLKQFDVEGIQEPKIATILEGGV
jgi:hypothetical protein